MVLSSASTPTLTPIPSSAAPGRTNELEGFVPPYTTKLYGEPPFPAAMPQDVWDDLIKSNPHYATQTMSTTDPLVHRLPRDAQTSSTEIFKAELVKVREDMSRLFKNELSQLGLTPSKSHLYQ
jgi:hypothetical protein